MHLNLPAYHSVMADLQRLELIPHQQSPARVSCVNPSVSVQPPDLASKTVPSPQSQQKGHFCFFSQQNRATEASGVWI